MYLSAHTYGDGFVGIHTLFDQDESYVVGLAQTKSNVIYFEADLMDSETLFNQIQETVAEAVNSAYGTDDRHELLAKLVADKVVLDIPIPWNSFKAHFGRADELRRNIRSGRDV